MGGRWIYRRAANRDSLFMALIITPGQLKQRAELYHTLGVLLSAGLTAPKALEQLERNPPSRSLRAPIAQLREHLRDGESVGDAVARMGGWMPAFDVALVNAGDRSGRLDACFKLLAGLLQGTGANGPQGDFGFDVPGFCFSFRGCAFCIHWCFQERTRLARFFLVVLGILLPIYAAAIFLILACQGRQGEKWRRWWKIFSGRFRCWARRDAAWRWRGWRRRWKRCSARGSSSPARGSWRWRRAVRPPWAGRCAAGRRRWSPVPRRRSWSGSPRISRIFSSLYYSGEISGQLDETLGRLHTLYQDEGIRKMRTHRRMGAAAGVLPRDLADGLADYFFLLGLYGPGSELDKS